MKYLFLTALFSALFSLQTARAQSCSPATAETTLHANNIRAFINQGGRLFTQQNWEGGLFPTTPNGSNQAPAIYAAGLWVGSVDPAGNLKLSISDYQAGFFAGPLDQSTGQTNADNCTNWDKVFSVKGGDIANFLAALNAGNQPAPTDFPSIFGWPAQHNPFFAAIHGFDLPQTNAGLAPFIDYNSDGVYNPMSGDYPAVQLRGKSPFVPAEIAWCVFNDEGSNAPSPSGGDSHQFEIQLTAWAFNCPDQPVLNNAVFTSHKIINRATELVDSLFAGLWMDFDLGCYWDDYLGSAPATGAFFAYNQDALDGNIGVSCDGTATFDSVVPVQSVVFLERSLDKFMVFNNAAIGNTPLATTDPSSPIEYYNYLTGHWRDGIPLTEGGSGYNPVSSIPADVAFPGDPADPNAWTMCSANLPFADRRVLASQKVGTVLPGQVEELNTAYITHWGADLPCGIGNAQAEMEAVKGIFKEDFEGVCSPLTPTQTPAFLEPAILVLPNPNLGDFQVSFGALVLQKIRVFAPDGRELSAAVHFSGEQARVELGSVPAGIYQLQLVFEGGVTTKNVVVQR